MGGPMGAMGGGCTVAVPPDEEPQFQLLDDELRGRDARDGGVVTGIGAPYGSRDISRDEPFLRMQRLQVEAIQHAQDDARRGVDSSGARRPMMSRLIRSMSFKAMKRSPAKSPRGETRSPRGLGLSPRAASHPTSPRQGPGARGQGPGASHPTSPDTSPRSTTSMPSSPRLHSLRLTEEAAAAMGGGGAAGGGMASAPAPSDPLAPRHRAALRTQLQFGGVQLDGGSTSAATSIGGGGGTASASKEDGDFARAFDAAFGHAADAAAIALMQRATARGEKFVPEVERSDFVLAVDLMATQLGLPLELPQINQLFDAVAGGSSYVQFEDFVDAPSTRYYLLQLADASRPSAEKKPFTDVEA